MEFSFSDWIISKFGQWLLKESPPRRSYLCDFHHICEEIRPGDVLLIEGRSRSSMIIQRITLSPWTHAALYIGQLKDIDDPVLQAKAKQHCFCTRSTQLLIESEIGLGTVISSVTKYQNDHIRILRPHGLSHEHVQKVTEYAIGRLGKKYNIRHLLDLARFLFPWGLFPRRWKSSLFQHNALQPTEDICSSMIADAFHSIHFPILPLVREDVKENLEIVRRNPRLFTPSDFDFSPYFDVIKYPIFKLGKDISPEDLPWIKDMLSDDLGEESKDINAHLTITHSDNNIINKK